MADFPYGFPCIHFDLHTLSANNFQVMEEEMFVTPICIDSRVRLIVFTLFICIFCILTIVGFVLAISTAEPRFTVPGMIKVLLVLHPLTRTLTLITALVNYESVLRYILYALPISIVFVVSSLNIIQWFDLTVHLKVFFQEATHILRHFKIWMIILNISFNVGIFAFWIAAAVVRYNGGTWQLHNILLGVGFAWQGVISIILSCLIFWAGFSLVKLLNKNPIKSLEIEQVAVKIKKTYQFCGTLGISVGVGSILTTVWMSTTLNSPRGMSGFFYLLIVFIAMEAFVPINLWILVLRNKETSSSTSPSSSSRNGTKPSERRSSQRETSTSTSTSTPVTFVMSSKGITEFLEEVQKPA